MKLIKSVHFFAVLGLATIHSVYAQQQLVCPQELTLNSDCDANSDVPCNVTLSPLPSHQAYPNFDSLYTDSDQTDAQGVSHPELSKAGNYKFYYVLVGAHLLNNEGIGNIACMYRDNTKPNIVLEYGQTTLEQKKFRKPSAFSFTHPKYWQLIDGYSGDIGDSFSVKQCPAIKTKPAQFPTVLDLPAATCVFSLKK